MRCVVFCLVVAPGFVHTLPGRSKSDHFACNVSPRRAPVRSINRMALAALCGHNIPISVSKTLA